LPVADLFAVDPTDAVELARSDLEDSDLAVAFVGDVQLSANYSTT